MKQYRTTESTWIKQQIERAKEKVSEKETERGRGGESVRKRRREGEGGSQ